MRSVLGNQSDNENMKHLTLEQFSESFTEAPEHCQILRADYLWEARCLAGVLVSPDGKPGFSNLYGLMSVLAGGGIRSCHIEWHDLPVYHFG